MHRGRFSPRKETVSDRMRSPNSRIYPICFLSGVITLTWKGLAAFALGYGDAYQPRFAYST